MEGKYKVIILLITIAFLVIIERYYCKNEYFKVEHMKQGRTPYRPTQVNEQVSRASPHQGRYTDYN